MNESTPPMQDPDVVSAEPQSTEPQPPVLAESPKLPHLKGWRRWLAAAGAVLVLAAGGVTVYVLTRPGPVDVVSDYLSVLQDGDAEAALEYASEVVNLSDSSEDLLVDEAIATDWEVTHIVRRHGEETGSATVDVTITADDKTTRQGRFHLDDTNGWRILNPLIKLNVAALPMQYAEFNGVTGNPYKAKEDDSSGQTVWLFPGAYRAYGTTAAVMDFATKTYVALPPAGKPGVQNADDPGESSASTPGVQSTKRFEVVMQNFLSVITVTDELDELNHQLAAWIDDCAAKAEPNPKGCPFAAGSSTDADSVSLANGDDFETDKVSWKVTTYPTIEITQGAGEFNGRVVEPGEITISGKGTARYGNDKPAERFSGRCAIKVEGVSITLEKPEVFDFTVAQTFPDAPTRTCSLRGQ